MKTRIHIAPNYFYNPTHPITISIIGMGGTGSLMLPRLARIDYALRQLGHPGIHVHSFDDDTVESYNVGRQLFTPCDVGAVKSVRAVTKVNHAFSLQWKGENKKVNCQNDQILSNIIITCVDNAEFRIKLAERLKYETYHNDYRTPYYWLDFGNGKKIGQFILGTVIQDPKEQLINTDLQVIDKLKNIVELFPNLQEFDTEQIQGAGCSYRDKLNEQSLFINDVLTANAGDMIFELLKNKRLQIHGKFINLETGRANPIPV
ncbi:PRTRC system ThiF family protein [Tenacibaculum sp. MAR_2009_124]|uniref:PRTRC system ThiF family protein n=1 Tax=Tenacibaculum sp. MAR_2009_124 TaxID=1250059 RepID=UPI000896C1F4|nr:PRTRC system ThiF family protein [Tenacibaculum sp. MAR_2009_124]SEC67885.1 PRTRC system ThiF family protein [Tenacibaculum sp. MAR_2009_124]